MTTNPTRFLLIVLDNIRREQRELRRLLLGRRYLPPTIPESLLDPGDYLSCTSEWIGRIRLDLLNRRAENKKENRFVMFYANVYTVHIVIITISAQCTVYITE